MTVRQHKAKKFHRKKYFLQISLLKFVYWRDTSFDFSLNEKKISLNTDCTVEKTVERELLFVRNFLQFFHHDKFFFNKLSTNTFIEKKNQKEMNHSSILSTFFPQARSFMSYWVLPFVGFVGLTFLNQNNQFKCDPSLRLWPYLKKTALAEKKPSYLKNISSPYEFQNQNDRKVELNSSHFSRNDKNKVFSLSWETLEYLNYKKSLYDQSKKYVNEIHVSEDNLCFVVQPNWIEHQKNQYSITFKDFNSSNRFAKNDSSYNDLEKKEIENLCKFYFYETQNFIYSPLREKSNIQASSAVYSAPNFIDKFRLYDRNAKQSQKNPKDEFLENILALNLWKRSSILLHWYQINPSEIQNSGSNTISNNLFSNSSNSKNNLWFWFFRNQAQKQKPTRSSLNELCDVARKKITAPEFYSQMNFIMHQINSLEKNWLNLDEFPKKIFPVTMKSNRVKPQGQSQSDTTNERSKEIPDFSKIYDFVSKNAFFEQQRTDRHANESILYDEKNLTLGLVLNSNAQPIQSYQKSSLLLDNLMKKLQLERQFHPSKNSSVDYKVIKRKKDFAYLIETKLNNINKLKYITPHYHHISSSYFSPKIFRSNSLKAYDASKIHKNSEVSNMNLSWNADSQISLSSQDNNSNSQNASLINNIKVRRTLQIKSKSFTKQNIKVKNSILSNIFLNTSVKKRASKNLQKIFYTKYLSFKTKNILAHEQKNISKTNQNTLDVYNMRNHFDVFTENISHDKNLINRLKELKLYRQFLKRHLSESVSSPKKNHSSRQRIKNYQISFWKKQNAHLGEFLSLLRKDHNTANAVVIKFDENQSLRKNIYKLSLLRRFNKNSKSSSMKLPGYFDFETNMTIDRKKHYDSSENNKHLSRVNLKIQRLSYDNQNSHLNDTFKKAKNIASPFVLNEQNNVSSIKIYRAPNQLKNPLVMSGYEFPEVHVKHLFSHTNFIQQKATEKFKKEKNPDIELMVSLPPTFSKSIHSSFNFTSKNAFFEPLTIKNDKNSHETNDGFANRIRNRCDDIAIKKQNSFLFQSRDDFFTSFKQNSVSNSNAYWSLLGYSHDQKNNISNKKDVSITTKKDAMNTPLKSSLVFQKKRWIQSMHHKINSFYEYFLQNIRSLFTKLNMLSKLVLTRIQHKLLDRHDFDFYVIFDSLNHSSDNSKKNEKEYTDQCKKKHYPRIRTKIISNLKQLRTQKESFSETRFFHETQNGRDIEKIPSIFYFKTLKNFDQESPIFHGEQMNSVELKPASNRLFQKIHSSNQNYSKAIRFSTRYFESNENVESNISETVFPRIFKLHKTKKCLKNSVLFKNIEKRKVEKIFRTYLSCKTNEASFLDKQKIASEQNAFEIARKKRMNTNNIHSQYVANALKRLQIRVKNNLFISNKNNLKKSIEIKQNSRLAPEIQKHHEHLVFSNRKYTKPSKIEDMSSSFALHSKNQKVVYNKYHSMKLYQISPNSLLKKLGFIFLNQSDKSFPFRKMHFSKRNHRRNNKSIYNKIISKKETALPNELTLNDVTYKTLESVEKSANVEKNYPPIRDLAEPKRYSRHREKQKYRQIKRRRKKQKLLNRRRKKRKRVHPRPKWLRFQLYNNILKKRHFKHHVNCHFGAIKLSNEIQNESVGIKTKMQNLNLHALSKKADSSSFYQFETKALDKCLKTKIYRQNKQQWGVSENPNFEKLTMKKIPLARSLPIFANHELYRVSNTIMSDFQRLCWKSYWLKSNLTPYIHRIQSSLKKLQLSQIHEQSSTTLKTFLLHFLGASSPQSSLKYDNDISSCVMNKTSSFLAAEKHPRLSWYVNVRQSFQNRNAIANFSVFYRTQNIAEYNRFLYERISDVIKNVRVNLNANGQNHAKSFKRGRHRKHRVIKKKVDNWWTHFRRGLQSEIRAFSSSVLPSSKSHGDLPTLRFLWSLNKQNIYNAPKSLKQTNTVKKLWETRKNRERKKSNKTKKFLYKSWKKFFPENFERYCFRKAVFVEDKIRYSGFIKKDYENYLIHLKMQFKHLHFSARSPMRGQSNRRFIKENNTLNPFVNTIQTQSESLSPQRLVEDKAKRSISFWWTSFSQKQWESIFMQQNIMLSNSSITQSAFVNFAIFNSLWICTILFHVCSLFFLLNIPEIRSLMKFNLLIFYKIVNAYLIVVYSIYDLLKNYKNQLVYSFGFVYPGLIKNATRLFSRNMAIRVNDSKPTDILAKHEKTSKRYAKKDIKQYAHYENKLKLKVVHQNAHYLSKNGVFLETTFRIPMQLHENFILNSLVETNDKKNKNEMKGIINPIRRIAKIKASCDAMRLEILNRLIDKRTVNKNITTAHDTGESAEKKYITPHNSTLPPHTSELNRIVTYEKASTTQILSHGFSTELISSKFKSVVSLVLLEVAKLSIVLIDNCIRLCHKTLFKCIDILESIMMIIYKFLERPAELIINWIANIFLVEWSSDIMTYVPDVLDSYVWNSYVLSTRSARLMGPIGFLVQRRLWCFMEIFIDFVSKPDADLATRQTKGTIFWNIWAEILIQAAERYNINVQSLTTIKEEQELLIEKLLDDETWGWSEKTSMNKTQDEMIPFIKMIENERAFPGGDTRGPQNWWDSTDLNERAFSLDFGPRSSLHTSMRFAEQRNSFILQNRKVLPRITKSRGKARTELKSSGLRREILSMVRFCHKGLLKDVKKAQKIHSNTSDIWRRWSTNQHLTYQGKDTDLFIDIHPPKSFRHITAIKYYQPAQQTLGSLVCQIYSGTFSKQVSKNILVIGAPGIGKSLLVQALAGETELKIITDNAHRYALVQSGVAVGIKLLRDVFDAIALHTPCLFLMEDIHVIGERRPMLISDDENAKATESFFASETEEVHEKNQLIYQLNRHALSHYKKPYRGDFSWLIPTNHFCFDLFLGVSPPKTRRLGTTPKSPLDIESIEHKIDPPQNEASLDQNAMNTSISRNKRFPFETLVSHLQISSEKYFAPPPTSPFTILMMKEQKKLVPKKLVKQMPWSGLSSDQMMLVSKVNYSIRVKVARLTEIAMRNLAVKLDMITDLLVIMDSVRSNRGFIVFATTHLPFILDPALRRPGRLDETISLPSLPSLINRWEIFKTNLSSFTNTLDFVDYSLLATNLRDTQISDFIAKSKLLLFNTTANVTPYKQKSISSPFADMKMAVKHQEARQINGIDLFVRRRAVSTMLEKGVLSAIDESRNDSYSYSKPYSKSKISRETNKVISSLNQAIKVTINADIIEPFQITKRVQKALMKSNKNKNDENSLLNRSIEKMHKIQGPNSLSKLLRSFDVYPSVPRGSSNLMSLTYFQMGKFLIDSQLLSDQTSYGRITWCKFLVSHNLEEQIFRDLYGARYDLKNILMRLFSGKVGEFFIFNNSSLCRYSYSASTKTRSHHMNLYSEKDKTRHDSVTSNALLAHSGVVEKTTKNNYTAQSDRYEKMITPNMLDIKMNENEFRHSGFWNVVGIHPFWDSANEFVSSLMQKRYLYNKNLLISRMLYFEDLSMRREPPSPPNSTISMPAKKYENLKRTENDFQQKPTMSIHEKIQLHLQQRLMKKLYNRPVDEYFRSELIENRVTKFSSSVKELGYLNPFTRRPSSVNCYYRNRILIRHQFSLLNQWWNGQLAEYSSETTFLSDVDWRSMFNKSLGDLLIDFPDADQHYNPRHRRWFLQSSYWSYWNTFDKTMSEEISYHFMIECFNKAYNFLNNEREILDYFAHSFLQKGILNEIHLITTLSRFYNFPTTVLK
uniref:Cell division protein n=1 Tax=Bracteacoccus minor TaxID=50037 RepID=A0A140HAJ1_9CHLO|nr:cell division protein [Bracteacoccus minor]AMO01190.1 cell division protein [Bracteacoccus minor]